MLMEVFSMPTAAWKGYLASDITFILILKLKQMLHLLINNILCLPKTVLFIQQASKQALFPKYRSFLLTTTKTYSIRTWDIISLGFNFSSHVYRHTHKTLIPSVPQNCLSGENGFM
jgi:hypothetical protein